MKKWFYRLEYTFKYPNGDSSSFLIGLFSSLSTAKNAVDMVKNKDGFKDAGGVFEFIRFAVSFKETPKRKSGLVLYELSHEYLDSDGYDNFTVFGVYSTREEAQEQYHKNLVKQPYKSYPENFLIADKKIDDCGWIDGFSKW